MCRSSRPTSVTPLLLLALTLLSQLPLAARSDGVSPLGECPYPCLPPPTSVSGNTYAPPPPPPTPLPPAQMSPGAGYLYPPPAGEYYPPSRPAGYYGGAPPPPPNPILPYFPWYYRKEHSASSRDAGGVGWRLVLSYQLALLATGLLLL